MVNLQPKGEAAVLLCRQSSWQGRRLFLILWVNTDHRASIYKKIEAKRGKE